MTQESVSSAVQKNILTNSYNGPLSIVDCGDPMLPADAMGTYNYTSEGATVIYQCADGFHPSTVMTTTCTNTAQWVPPIVNCTG